MTREELEAMFTQHDLKRLDSYARNLVDYHVCMDLLPTLARSWFLNTTPVSVSVLQAALLLGMGLQHKTIDDLEVCAVQATAAGQTCTEPTKLGECAERAVAAGEPDAGAVQPEHAQAERALPGAAGDWRGAVPGPDAAG